MVTASAGSLLGYAVEDALEEAKRRKKLRRSGIYIIALLNLLVLADGVSGVSDLHRRATVQGAAAAWADAATAADCPSYRSLETPNRLAADLAGIRLGPKIASQRAGLCALVTAAWLGISITGSDVVARAGDAAVVRLTVTEEAGAVVTGEVLMSHAGGRWRVDLAPPPCVRPAYSPEQSLCSAVALPAT